MESGQEKKKKKGKEKKGKENKDKKGAEKGKKSKPSKRVAQPQNEKEPAVKPEKKDKKMKGGKKGGTKGSEKMKGVNEKKEKREKIKSQRSGPTVQVEQEVEWEISIKPKGRKSGGSDDIVIDVEGVQEEAIDVEGGEDVRKTETGKDGKVGRGVNEEGEDIEVFIESTVEGAREQTIDMEGVSADEEEVTADGKEKDSSSKNTDQQKEQQDSKQRSADGDTDDDDKSEDKKSDVTDEKEEEEKENEVAEEPKTAPSGSVPSKASQAKLVTYTQPKVLTKDIDIVIYGASGFTGRLGCLYLAGYPDQDFITKCHLAIAGRSKERLVELQSELTRINNFMGRVSLLTANAFSTQELDRITSRARCLLNFAGPYVWYGSLVVESCVRNMCHYVDLSGELPWIVKMAEKHETRAIKNKVRVINGCGFHSVPSDLGIMTVANYARECLNQQLTECFGLVVGLKYGFSGSASFESMLHDFRVENKQYYDEMMKDPQYYNPPDKRNGLDMPDPTGTLYMKDFKTWTSPSVTGRINARVVRRSNALLDYGNTFTYTEMVMNSSWMSAKLSSSSRLSSNSSRKGKSIKKLDPKSAFSKCYFQMKFVGAGTQSLGRRISCEVKGRGDPEYDLSAKMMVEAGILLSKFQDGLPDNPKSGFGFQTIASGLGNPYIQRLTKYAGISFSVGEIAMP